jgi:hypothetical protein
MGPLDWIPIAVFVASAGAAGFVIAVAPRNATNRALAGFLLLFAGSEAVYSLHHLVPDRAVDYNAEVWGDALQLASVPVYLWFVGLAIRSRLAQPWRARSGRGVLVASFAASLLLPWLFPAFWFSGPETALPGGYTTWRNGMGDEVANLLTVAASLYGLIASLHALARAKAGTRERAYARAYFAAFVVGDVAVLLSEIDWIPSYLGIGPAGLFQLQGLMYGIVSPLVFVAFLAILVRAVVQRQLFDFDLRLKVTLRRGTIVGAFVAVFVVVTAVAEQYLQQLGWLAGGLAIGAMLVVLRPIERAADRLAEAAMPSVQPTPAYVQFKKLEVYRAAVESAFDAGGIDAKGRRVLEGLRTRLGIGAEDALALEGEVADAPA